MADPRIDRKGASFILYDGSVLDQVSEHWFLEPYWRERELVVAEVPGRGATLFVSQAEEVWVLRHYRRGGFMAGLTDDHYLWMGLERTRAFQEWRLLHDLFARGMPVPRPIAAHVSRKGLGYRADIVTACIENTQSWASLISSGEVRDSHWQSIGSTVRRFHDEGVDHTDLTAHNILIDDQHRIFVVDFDKGSFRSHGRWKKGNLKRLLRSLRKISLETGAVFDEEGWHLLVSSYHSAR